MIVVYHCLNWVIYLVEIVWKSNCVEVKLCVLMVWLVMCLCMNKAIAWLGCRLFLHMASQLSLEYNVSHCLISDDL